MLTAHMGDARRDLIRDAWKRTQRMFPDYACQLIEHDDGFVVVDAMGRLWAVTLKPIIHGFVEPRKAAVGGFAERSHWFMPVFGPVLPDGQFSFTDEQELIEVYRKSQESKNER
jgi:hypothetical protein